MSVSFCLPHPVAVSAFMICRGLCACTEMLWMCVLYVTFASKVRPRTFGCVAMGSALLFIVRSRLLVYPANHSLILYYKHICKNYDYINNHITSLFLSSYVLSLKFIILTI